FFREGSRLPVSEAEELPSYIAHAYGTPRYSRAGELLPTSRAQGRATQGQERQKDSLSFPVISLWGRPIKTVDINGQPVSMLLDTGADDTIIQDSDIKISGELTPKVVGGLGGLINVKQYKGVIVKFNEKRIVATVLVSPTPINILGRNCLSKLEITLNMVMAGQQLKPTKVSLKERKKGPMVKQWPLSKEKIEALKEITQKMIKLGQLEEAGPNNPYNSPVFAIRKKDKTKWRMLIDFRKLNEVTQEFAEVQTGIPHPSGLAQKAHVTIVDMQDAFYSVPLDKEFRPYTAFSVPAVNNMGPAKRFQFKVLPQGWKGSPTIFQATTAKLLEQVRKDNQDALIVQYMDDLLIGSDREIGEHRRLVKKIRDLLSSKGIQTPEDKHQPDYPVEWLGYELHPKGWRIKPVELPDQDTWTVNEIQKLVGKLNWAAQVYSGIKTKHLCRCIRGIKGLTELVELSEQAQLELAENREILKQEAGGAYYDPEKPLVLEIVSLGEQQWGYTFTQDRNMLRTGKFAKIRTAHSNPYQQLAEALSRASKEALVCWGKTPDKCRIPVVKEQWDNWWADSWQTTWIPDIEAVHTPYLLRQWFTLVPEPIETAPTYYVDGAANRNSKLGRAGYVTDRGQERAINLENTTNQQAELQAILLALMDGPPEMNLVTDSQYALGIITAAPEVSESPLVEQIIQQMLSKNAIFISRVPAHKGIGGNEEVDHLVSRGIRQVLFMENIDPAVEDHEKYHSNWKYLRDKYNIPTILAKEIVNKCSACQTHGEPKHGQVNADLGVWQMDCTHLEGKVILVAVHVASSFIWARIISQETGRLTALELSNLAATWPISQIHPDNGTNFTSKEFQAVAWWANIQHTTGVPYNPQSQGVVENANKQLKETIHKVREEVTYLETAVAQAVFILNNKRKGGIGDMTPTERLVNMLYTELEIQQLQNHNTKFSKFRVYYRRGANPYWLRPARLLWKGEGALVIKTKEGEIVTVPRRKAKIIKDYGTRQNVDSEPDSVHVRKEDGLAD
ncbi:pol protein, partial [Simian immunodeficiency virus]